MSLRIKRREKNNCEIIKLVGEASNEEIYKLSKAIEEARTKGRKKIAVDMSEATFLDSSALGVLILNLKIIRKEQGSLCLLYPTG